MAQVDYQVHLHYYDSDRDISYIWNGIDVSVDVCPGGYGESVDVTFEHGWGYNPQLSWSPYTVFTKFVEKCDEWACGHYDDNDDDDDDKEMVISKSQPCCDDCWQKREGDRVPQRLSLPNAAMCVFCGVQNRSGIFVRIDINDRATYPYPSEVEEANA